ncbi:MAG: hypothetical protein KC493_17220, partial [Bacteriovoracaceae bacterium]|nr:hypothetical protein [Bacteriovoracaceae bacterium]
MTDQDYQCKVAIVNSRESGGGAATIAASLSKSIEHSKLFVDQSSKTKRLFNTILEKILNKMNKKKKGVIWSNGRRGNLDSFEEFNKFDIVHLNWINDSYISVESISKIKRPIVWTLHDLWPLTGGCHIPFKCIRYQEDCGNCPYLNSSSFNDLSWKNYHQKKEAFRNKKIYW